MGGIGERKGEGVGFPVNILMITMPIKRVTTAGRRRGQRMREHGEELWEKHEEQICSFCSLNNTKKQAKQVFLFSKKKNFDNIGTRKTKIIFFTKQVFTVFYF